jgi:hypothetical protein
MATKKQDSVLISYGVVIHGTFFYFMGCWIKSFGTANLRHNLIDVI